MTELTAPHDVLGKKIGPYLPGEERLLQMQERSYEILKEHPLNKERKEKGLAPANSFWFWGAGTKPALSSLDHRMLIMPDHPTPIRLRTHTASPVPYLLYDSTAPQTGVWRYQEDQAGQSGNVIRHGWDLMRRLFQED